MFATLFREAALWSGLMVLAGALAGSVAIIGASEAKAKEDAKEVLITEIFVDFEDVGAVGPAGRLGQQGARLRRTMGALRGDDGDQGIQGIEGGVGPHEVSRV